MSKVGTGGRVVLAVFATAACASRISTAGRSVHDPAREAAEEHATKPATIPGSLPEPSDGGRVSEAGAKNKGPTDCEQKTVSFRRKGDPNPGTQTGGVDAPPAYNGDVAYRLECRGGVPILRVHVGQGYVMTHGPPDPYWQDVTLSRAEWVDLWKRLDGLTLANCAGPGEVHREVRIAGASTRAATCDATDAPAFDALENLFSKIKENREEEGLRRLLDHCKNGCWEGKLR